MLITLIAVGIGAMHAPASAPDFVFQVPVRIENMTHITTASVACEVVHDAPGLPTPINLNVPGTGITSVPVAGGAYAGNVTVTVTVTADRLARYTPTSWSCAITYRWRNPDGTTFTESVRRGEREGIYTRLTGQAISESTVTVTGPLPPP
ncbi:MAG TPA: hypothetical protein VES88_15405 [Gemmatimonadaceae bacterium]|nr:hypothetical protein [Gemmatimonadaceae bacterium]